MTTWARRGLCSALLANALALGGLSGQALPRVHVIATGGTIASSAGGTVGVEVLIDGVPELAGTADLTFDQVLSTGSSRITPADWLVLAQAVSVAFASDPDLSGVVITHGTDSMEETAYFLDLVVESDRPVVLTGAMRSADAIGPDGPANLFNAVRVAAAPESEGHGTLVVMNDEIHRARNVVKTNTLRVHAFASPTVGAIGVVDRRGPVFKRSAGGRPARFDLSGVRALPVVEVDYAFVGSQGSGIRHARSDGAEGIIIASFGSGRVSADQAEQIKVAVEQGLTVVLSSRVGSGRVQDEYGGQLGSGGRSVVLADDLNPQKARVLLMVALTQTRDVAELVRIFEVY